jgi:S1-C subfamily serine protease
MPTYERYSPRYPIGSYVWPLVLLLVVVGLLIWRFGGNLWPSWPSGPTAIPDVKVEPAGNLSELEKATIALYEKASPSVVHVTNLAERRVGFSLNVQQSPRGTGTGFVWAQEGRDGYIVTNNHVVQDADAVQVVLNDHSAYAARSVWVNPDKDLAVIWIDVPAGKLKPLEITTSRNLKVGQSAFAIGNPFGLDQSLTNGIVSALGREIESGNGRPLRGVIQTSAAINPGNSGGPLLNSSAQLIGVNTAIVSPSGASAGIGFAIPSDDVKQVVDDLIRRMVQSKQKRGMVTAPRLGVQIAEDKMAQELGVRDGVLVIKVVPASPAEAAGLQPTRLDEEGQVQLGDVILAIDAKPVKAAKDLHTILQQHKVGETIKVTVRRQGKKQDVEVTLEGGGG